MKVKEGQRLSNLNLEQRKTSQTHRPANPERARSSCRKRRRWRCSRRSRRASSARNRSRRRDHRPCRRQNNFSRRHRWSRSSRRNTNGGSNRSGCGSRRLGAGCSAAVGLWESLNKLTVGFGTPRDTSRTASNPSLIVSGSNGWGRLATAIGRVVPVAVDFIPRRALDLAIVDPRKQRIFAIGARLDAFPVRVGRRGCRRRCSGRLCRGGRRSGSIALGLRLQVNPLLSRLPTPRSNRIIRARPSRRISRARRVCSTVAVGVLVPVAIVKIGAVAPDSGIAVETNISGPAVVPARLDAAPYPGGLWGGRTRLARRLCRSCRRNSAHRRPPLNINRIRLPAPMPHRINHPLRTLHTLSVNRLRSSMASPVPIPRTTRRAGPRTHHARTIASNKDGPPVSGTGGSGVADGHAFPLVPLIRLRWRARTLRGLLSQQKLVASLFAPPRGKVGAVQTLFTGS